MATAFKSRGAKQAAQSRAALNPCCSLQSADVRDPFLGLRLGCGSGLCRKLEHSCFLTF
jgi:hypothetical protein